MSFDAADKRARRREVQCFWAGIVTAVAVAAYRVYITATGTLWQGHSFRVSMDIWMTNGIILWSLTLFMLAWLFWRDSRRRQDELTTVVRSIIPDVLLVTDAAGRVWMSNPAVQTMFGYSPEELVRRETAAFLRDRPVIGAEREVYEQLRGMGHEVRPATGIRKDGTQFPAEITTASLLKRNGAVILVRDITERWRVEQLRENLTHLLVHDLRNPLFGISGNLHVILTLSDNLPEDVSNSVKVALDFVQEIGEMLRCLEDLTQLEAGAWCLRTEVVDIAELADKALATLDLLIGEKRHAIVWARAPAPFRCDPALIERVILNLLRNAVEATPSGGRIEIRIQRTAEALHFSVTDNGPGVPREFQTLIFEKFGRPSSGRQSKRRASGLGLVFCKLAIEAHGGTIGVDSTSDQGSTFWFQWPTGVADTRPSATDDRVSETMEATGR